MTQSRDELVAERRAHEGMCATICAALHCADLGGHWLNRHLSMESGVRREDYPAGEAGVPAFARDAWRARHHMLYERLATIVELAEGQAEARRAMALGLERFVDDGRYGLDALLEPAREHLAALGGIESLAGAERRHREWGELGYYRRREERTACRRERAQPFDAQRPESPLHRQGSAVAIDGGPPRPGATGPLRRGGTDTPTR